VQGQEQYGCKLTLVACLSDLSFGFAGTLSKKRADKHLAGDGNTKKLFSVPHKKFTPARTF